MSERDFERIKSVVGRTAQLQFKVVDDQASEYMRKVAATCRRTAPSPSSPTSGATRRPGAPREVIFLVAKDRTALEQFVAGLKGDVAVPNDREFGYEAVDAPGAEPAIQPGPRAPGALTCCIGGQG